MGGQIGQWVSLLQPSSLLRQGSSMTNYLAASGQGYAQDKLDIRRHNRQPETAIPTDVNFSSTTVLHQQPVPVKVKPYSPAAIRGSVAHPLLTTLEASTDPTAFAARYDNVLADCQPSCTSEKTIVDHLMGPKKKTPSHLTDMWDGESVK